MYNSEAIHIIHRPQTRCLPTWLRTKGGQFISTAWAEPQACESKDR